MKTLLVAFLALLANGVVAGDVRPTVMDVLPLGSVRPEGFLRDRLVRQAEGLTGHAEELYDDIGKSDWLTGGKSGGMYAWERGPYYAKGLVALAFALDDAALKKKATRWVDAIVLSQRANGDFGPKSRNWWGNMIAIQLLRDWADATGDVRIVPFLERYFRFQRAEFEAYPLSAESRWAVARAGDELDVVLWLYGKTGKGEWREFAECVAAQSTDWTRYYRRGGNPGNGDNGNGFCCHIVNFMQGLKTPALQWRLDGDNLKRTAYHAAFSSDGWLMKCYGRPDFMLNGSEQLSDRSASGGTELCAVAERIVSCQTQIASFGDVKAADDLEVVAYNTLMSMVATDGRGITYYSLINQPACIDRPLNFANNGEDVGAICPGPHSGFGCCRSNFHMAWPKFVQSMWMSHGGGLAAVAYGPCTVSTPTATVAESGMYPFGEEVQLEIKATNGGEWPLFVRIPAWCENATVKVNGADFEVCGETSPLRFRRISRVWKVGDVITLAFPQKTRLSYWERGAVAVRRGALLYALKITGEESEVKRYKVPYEDRWIEDGICGFPRKEIRPVSSWGYALLLGRDGRIVGEKVCETGLELRACAVRTDFGGWGHMRKVTAGRAVDPPPSPLPREDGEIETISLVPFGLTRVRIALFPWMDGG